MSTFILWPNGSTIRPRITSPFGRRPSPVPGASTNHRGTDFVGYAKVRAIADGVVQVVGTPSGWSAGGIQVWVQHDGFLTRSMHLASTSVRPGQRVTAGTELGAMGRTGNVSGIHHHLEVVVNGQQIDPVPFITNRLEALAGAGTSKPAVKPTTFPEIGDEMFIADCPNGSFLIVPQGSARPRAVVLDGGSGAGASGIPRLKFESTGSLEMLTAAVQF